MTHHAPPLHINSVSAFLYGFVKGTVLVVDKDRLAFLMASTRDEKGKHEQNNCYK